MLNVENFREEFLKEIARKHLGLETLETRKRDSLDFKEVAVWAVKDALNEVFEEAFQAGRQSIEKQNETLSRW